jgi:putative chitinase
MTYDPKIFFDSIRTDLYGGSLGQSQVDGFNYLLSVWEQYFEAKNPRDGTNWLAYCLATVYHETAYTIEPIEEYGKGVGKSYGNPAGPYNQIYYGRGYPQLTWWKNYIAGQTNLKNRYNVVAPLEQQPQQMLIPSVSSLVLYDGMVYGWFTGNSLQTYFNATIEDPVNARKIVNGLDKASLIASYYSSFKKALVQTTVAPPIAAPQPPISAPQPTIATPQPPIATPQPPIATTQPPIPPVVKPVPPTVPTAPTAPTATPPVVEVAPEPVPDVVNIKPDVANVSINIDSDIPISISFVLGKNVTLVPEGKK